MVGVYILRSDKNSCFYVGSTSDIEKRLIYHNLGRVKSTRNLRPWKLIRFLPCENEAVARGNELRLKKYKRKDILEKVIKDGMFPWDH